MAFSIKDVHDFFEEIIEKTDTLGKEALATVAADAKAALATAETDALKAVASAAPDVQAAVQNALRLAEQALIAALAAHGL